MITPFPRSQLAGLLTGLKAIYPPSHVVHVGAGRGLGDLHVWRQWSIAHALVLDADEQRVEWAKQQTDVPDWHVVHATLAQQAGEVEFFQASNADEDGLVAPERLKALWPNLRRSHTTQRQARTLDDVVSQAFGTGAQSTCGWLIIDCLPAQQILRGGAQALAQSQLVCVRAAQIGTGEETDELGPAAIGSELAQQGFIPVAALPGNNPAVLHVVYVRDQRARIAQLESQASALEQARDAEAKAKAEAIQQRDVEAAANKEAQAQITKLTQAHDAEDKSRMDVPIQLEQLQSQAKQKDERIAWLEASLSEMETRQRLMNDELTRAEAQIDLIKDLCLREPRL